MQASWLGFVRALRRFDLARGVHLTVFAHRFVLRAARDYFWHEDAYHDHCNSSLENQIEPYFSQPAPLDEEVRRAVAVFLKNLPERLRAVVQCHYWEGHTLSEVAAEYGVSRMAVSNWKRDVIERGKRELATFAETLT